MANKRAVLAAIALGASALLSGCGATQADTAAVVNGHVITEADAQVAARQINTAFNLSGKDVVTPAAALNFLILADPLIAMADKTGAGQSTNLVRSQLQQRMEEPAADSTVRVVQAAGARQAAQNLPADAQKALVEQIQKLKVTVNPRYGTFTPATAGLEPLTPNWLSQKG